MGIVSGVAKRISNSGNNELVLFTQDTHGDDYLQTPEGIRLPIVHCIENSWGWHIDDTVYGAWLANSASLRNSDAPLGHIFTKEVFGSDDLVSFLKPLEHTIDTIELLGICTDICVVTNAILLRNAMPHSKIVINSALCAGTSPKSHEQALDILKMCHLDII